MDCNERPYHPRPRMPFALRLGVMGFQKDETPGLGRDPLTYTKVAVSTRDEFRVVDVQLWRDGKHRSSHFLNGSMTTHPSEFTDIEGMVKAVEHEATRKDHPRDHGKRQAWHGR